MPAAVRAAARPRRVRHDVAAAVAARAAEGMRVCALVFMVCGEGGAPAAVRTAARRRAVAIAEDIYVLLVHVFIRVCTRVMVKEERARSRSSHRFRCSRYQSAAPAVNDSCMLTPGV